MAEESFEGVDESTRKRDLRSGLPLTNEACLVVIYGVDLGRRYPLNPEKNDVSIGRDRENDIVLDHQDVSRRHAELRPIRDRWFINDLLSTNGTEINGRRIEGETVLTNGDYVNVGGVIFKYIAGGNLESLFHEEVYRLTVFDGLTRLHNKRHLMEFLDREIARARRHQRPLSLLMIDIDHFKAINDTRGHLGGDHLLSAIGALLRGVARQDELLARYGGEEFALVLPESDVNAAVTRAEELRVLVEETPFTVDGETVKLTVSAGVAGFSVGMTRDHLISAADRQLYAAKREGRNRVCAYVEERLESGPAAPEQPIRNVSDTARWAAVYRARETDRADALFRDPFARTLAGDRGEQIISSLPKRQQNDWAWVSRTVNFDDFLERALDDGADAVLNLAAGLDARPYRMKLPSTLRWIEVDLPELLAYKETVLAGQKPNCSLERISMDLSDVTARRTLFERIAGQANKVVVLTEGLLVYLSPDDVATLAHDLAQYDAFRYWIFDILSPGLKRLMEKQIGAQLQAASAPFRFAPLEGPRYFFPFGWNPIEVRSALKTGKRLGRLPLLLQLFALFPESNDRQGSRPWSGTCFMERARRQQEELPPVEVSPSPSDVE